MNTTSKWVNYKYTDFLDLKNTEIKNLPEGTTISTMCASLKLNTKLNIINIDKYLQLNSDDIITVQPNKERIRTLLTKKKLSQAKIDKIMNTKSNNFYNQITVVVRVSDGVTEDINKEPRINMKLFKNGSVQMSGCKSIKNINIAINKLIVKLKEIKGRKEDNKIVEIKFIDDYDTINVSNFKIDMINSNYKINMMIDRDKLYSLLLKKKIRSSYEPCSRACVIIKYVPDVDNVDMKDVSIFIFQLGNIIITGAKSGSHIISSYNYINNILSTHYEDILKKDEKKDENLILNLYDNIMDEVNIGLIKI